MLCCKLYCPTLGGGLLAEQQSCSLPYYTTLPGGWDLASSL